MSHVTCRVHYKFSRFIENPVNKYINVEILMDLSFCDKITNLKIFEKNKRKIKKGKLYMSVNVLYL